MQEQRCYGCMKLKSGPGKCEYCGYDIQSMANRPHQLAAGTVLKNQYLVGKALGQGGFGITYIGWDINLETPVALKEYYPSDAVTRNTALSSEVTGFTEDANAKFEKSKERFVREAKTLARFAYIPEIVQVKNFFRGNNTAYIVMEYVEGITLKEYVKAHGGRLSMDETSRILRPVMEALEKVHEAGIIHRDISPDNIMMLADGRAKLIDFGTVRNVGDAKIGQELTKSTESVLKQGYAPLEQYQSRGNLGPWTDVYGFCATIYYCLTGKAPQDAPGRLLGDEGISLRAQGAEITEEQERALCRGLELRAKDRTGSMRELCEELFAPAGVLEKADERISENNTPNQKNKKRSRKKTAAYAGILAVCVIGIVVLSMRPWQAGGETDSAGRRVQDVSAGSLENELSAAEEAPQAADGEAAADAERQQMQEDFVWSGQCGEDIRWELDWESGTLTLSGTGETYYYGITTDAIREEMQRNGVPEEWLVVEEADWFRYGYEGLIKHIVIEDGITGLNWNLFHKLPNLTDVDLGTVTHIRNSCFAETGLKEVNMPDTVVCVEGAAFEVCGQLESVTIPNGSEGVYAGSFQTCTALKSMTFGPDAQLVGDLMSQEYDYNVINEELVYYGYRGSSVQLNAMEYNIPFESLD